VENQLCGFSGGRRCCDDDNFDTRYDIGTIVLVAGSGVVDAVADTNVTQHEVLVIVGNVNDRGSSNDDDDDDDDVVVMVGMIDTPTTYDIIISSIVV
jgi:hypothetical protein